MLNITIPLERFIAAILRAREYAVVDENDANMIRSVENYESVCKVENSDMTTGYGSVKTLPALAPGLWRVWYIKDWNETYNQRKIVLDRIESANAETMHKRQYVIDSFIRSHIPETAAKQIVAGMSYKVMVETYDTLKQSSGEA